MKKLFLLFIFLHVLVRTETFANHIFEEKYVLENDSLKETTNKLNTTQKWIVGGLAVQQAASLYLEYKWWWEDNYHPFVIRSDGGFNNYSLGVDKVGHAYISYMYSNMLYELMKWGDFKESTSEWVSLILPFAWALSIEIGDGFSSYEFSKPDLLANSIGIAYAFAQRKVPVLKNLNFKFSYFPSSYYMKNGPKGWSLTGDYDGHIYWLTADINGFLPAPYKQYWPKYLNLGVGYGIDNFTAITKNAAINPVMSREFFIGLDYNLSRIPIKGKTAKTIQRMVDYIHLPAPGMKKLNNGDWEFNALILN
ncbi:MAG: YfiM family protein [Bacteroidia bacterium]|nr:YfiM family protein [Bacteroidia bacterium]